MDTLHKFLRSCNESHSVDRGCGESVCILYTETSIIHFKLPFDEIIRIHWFFERLLTIFLSVKHVFSDIQFVGIDSIKEWERTSVNSVAKHFSTKAIPKIINISQKNARLTPTNCHNQNKTEFPSHEDILLRIISFHYILFALYSSFSTLHILLSQTKQYDWLALENVTVSTNRIARRYRLNKSCIMSCENKLVN